MLQWRYPIMSGVAAVLVMLTWHLHRDWLRYDENHCDMTYMFRKLFFMDFGFMPGHRYRLLLYGEGYYAVNFRSTGHVDGIPIIFVPGNAGSSKQARSLGSVLQNKTESRKTPYHFDVYTIDYNEEFSALSSNYLQYQVDFLAESIVHVYEKYTPRRKIILYGHSVGGILARSVLSKPGVQEMVMIVFGLASPFSAPPYPVDRHMAAFWTKLGNSSISTPTISVDGGLTDLLIAPEWTYAPYTHHASTNEIEGVFVECDHQSIVWCNQLVRQNTRVLFDLAEAKNVKTEFPEIFTKHFECKPKVINQQLELSQTIDLNSKIEWIYFSSIMKFTKFAHIPSVNAVAIPLRFAHPLVVYDFVIVSGKPLSRTFFTSKNSFKKGTAWERNASHQFLRVAFVNAPVADSDPKLLIEAAEKTHIEIFVRVSWKFTILKFLQSTRTYLVPTTVVTSLILTCFYTEYRLSGLLAVSFWLGVFSSDGILVAVPLDQTQVLFVHFFALFLALALHIMVIALDPFLYIICAIRIPACLALLVQAAVLAISLLVNPLVGSAIASTFTLIQTRWAPPFAARLLQITTMIIVVLQIPSITYVAAALVHDKGAKGVPVSNSFFKPQLTHLVTVVFHYCRRRFIASERFYRVPEFVGALSLGIWMFNQVREVEDLARFDDMTTVLVPIQWAAAFF